MEPETKQQQQRKLVAAVTLPHEMQERVVDLANEREWSVAQAGGYLIRLGLERLEEMRCAPKAADAEDDVAVAA